MKSTSTPSKLLVLDCQPDNSGLGQEFLSVIEPYLGASKYLIYQHFALVESDRCKAQMADAIAQSHPSLIFLIAPPELIDRLVVLIDTSICMMAPMILVTREGDSEKIYRLLTLGVADYMISPLDALVVIPRVWRLLDEVLAGALSPLRSIIGESKVLLNEINKIPLIAGSDDCVLITGETGAGKELCALAIHQLSNHRDDPFVPVNCGAIPAELLENELFGHERGAYTGAGKAYPGLVQTTEGGTLFLDEINSLPLTVQAKLLRFLQEKEYRNLGSNKMLKAAVRIITAANIDIEGAARTGLFRNDLYHRLNVMRIDLPPLRSRREDIPLLARHFLAKHSTGSNGIQKRLSIDAMLALMIYEWPGNVRELEHVIQCTLILCEQPEITGEDIRRTIDVVTPDSLMEATATVIEQFEQGYLQELLHYTRGNISRAAEIAEMDRHDLRRLLQKHGIDAQEFKNN